MVLQLTFEQSIYVSKEIEGLDILQIKVLDENFFVAKASTKPVEEPTVLTYNLP